MAKLSKFEGREVLGVGLEIKNAAGGLNEALAVDPAEWRHGQQVDVVLRCEVVKVRHDEVKDTDGLRRVHVLSATEATVIDADEVEEALERQRIRLEEAAGVHRLDLEGNGEGENE